MAPLREPDRRRRGRRGIWIAGILAVTMLVGWYGYGLWIYANHDRPELIDDPAVASVVERSCTAMTLAVTRSGPRPGPPAHRRAESIRDQNDAIAQMVAEVRGIGHDTLANDRPTEDWLKDWERLAEARARSAERLDRGAAAEFELPRVDGQPITTRMDQLGACPVPDELTRVG